MKQEAIKQRVEHVRHGLDRGWAFTPIHGKAPFRRGWQTEPPADHDTTTEWARHGNIALRTGQVSGVVVIDDDTEGGSGTAELELPETVTVVTGSGKRHFYFRCPEGRLGNSSRGLPKKVDVRGDGGCIVFPGSIHPDTGDMYRWAPGRSPDEIELAELPESVLARLRKAPNKPAPAPATTRGNMVDLPILSSGEEPPNAPKRLCNYAHGVLSHARRRIGSCGVGARNDTLNREAFSLGRYVAWRAIDEGFTRRMLMEAGIRSGLGEREANATVESGLQSGKQNAGPVEQELERLDKNRAGGGGGSGDGEHGASPGASLYGTEWWFARSLVDQHGRDLRFVGGSRRKWFSWVDAEGRWKLDDTGEVQRRAKDVVSRITEEAWSLRAALEDGEDVDQTRVKAVEAVAKKFQAKAQIENAIALASSEAAVVATNDQWDADRWLLNVTNGTLDLKKRRLRAARREDYMTKRCAVAFHPDATAPRWREFLERILPDAEIREYLQRFLGYALTGDVGEHVLHVLWGSGANGKTVLLEVIRFVLGEYGVTAPASLLLTARGDKHPTDRTVLHEARIAISSETPEHGRLDEATMKSLTGGDTIMARGMREDYWPFSPTHKLVLATNHRPQIAGTDNGVWRRLRLVPFAVCIPEKEQDPHLLEKLKQEADGILVWMLDGLREYQKRRLEPPDAVRLATHEYRRSEDILGEFIEDRLLEAPGQFLPSSALLAAYVHWCNEQGIPDVRRLTTRTLTTRLKERGFAHKRTRDSKGFADLKIVGRGS